MGHKYGKEAYSIEWSKVSRIEAARLPRVIREYLTLPYVFGKEDPYICPSRELMAGPAWRCCASG